MSGRPFTVVSIDPQTSQGYDLSERIKGLQFSNVNPGGDELCRFRLDVPWRTLFPPASKGNLCRVLSGPDVLWDGRIEELDPSGDDSEFTAVTAYGKGARNKDTTMQEIYIDQLLSGWLSASRQRKINLYTTAPTWDKIFDAQATHDPATGLPALELILTPPWPNRAVDEAWYDAGPGALVAVIYYDFESQRTLIAHSFTVGVADDDVATNASSAGDLIGVANASGTGYYTAPVARRWAWSNFLLNAADATNQDEIVYLRKFAMYGNHGLARGALTPGGFTADQLVRDVIGRVPGMVARRIDAQTYEIQQMAFQEPTYHEDAIVEINQLEGCDWGTWGPDSILDFSTNGYFDYTNPDSTTRHWSCFQADCDEIDLHTEMSTTFDRVQVMYTDVAGRSQIVVRTTAVPELDRVGLVRTATLQAGTMTLAGAQTYGDAFLALQGAYAPARGTVTISRPIRHYRLGLRAPWWMRANGSNLQIPDILPSQQLFGLATGPDRRSTFPIKRVTVDASGDYPTVHAELDQTADLLSILQARLGIAAELVGVDS